MQRSVLAVRAPLDLLLHHLAPLGLAAARTTALVVDLDPAAPAYPGSTTVAMLLEDGLRREHLGPSRPGVAVLGHGGARAEDALPLVEALAGEWPAVVVRAPRAGIPLPTVTVHPEFPAIWDGLGSEPAVLQALRPFPAGGPGRLPPLRPGQVRAMLAGRIGARWRWVSAWRQVWEMPWG